MEMLYIYAPEPPYKPLKILTIFYQLVTHISNLSHATNDTNNIHHGSYVCLLKRLATVKMGVILLELNRTYDDLRQKMIECL